ncbi:hypothetical protein [Paraburkholderia youngii]|uniref:hypothetical protein n=1 Tax=Paraburkholderia youngii TaxID=2782701 RepID=UPI003D23F408
MDTNAPHFWILWDIVNIFAPILLTPAAMLLVVAGKSDDQRYKDNGHLMTVLKDGQMGFVAVTMALAMVMEILGKQIDADMGIALVTLVTCAIGGAFVAALGAVYTTERKGAPKLFGKTLFQHLRYYSYMWLSFVFVGLASGVTHYTRWHLIK